MKCKNMIVIEERKAKGTGKPYQKVLYTLGQHITQVVPKEAVLCSGDIKVRVCIEDIGSCRCSGGSVHVEYLCLRCGNQSFPEFPEAEDGISEFMTRTIAKMSDSQYAEILKEYLDQRSAWDRSVQKHKEEALEKIRIRKGNK